MKCGGRSMYEEVHLPPCVVDWRVAPCPACGSGLYGALYFDAEGRVAGCGLCIDARSAAYACGLGVQCCPVCGTNFAAHDVTAYCARGPHGEQVVACAGVGCWTAE